MGGHDEAQLAAGADQDQFRTATRRVGHHVGSAGQAGGRGVAAAIERGHWLPRQHENRRLVPELENDAIGLDHLVGIAGPDHDQPGHRPPGDQLLHGLVGRTVLAVAHGVVCEDEERGQLHQRREPDRRPRVVAEDEEGGPERPDLRQREPVDDRRHGVLADPEVKVSAAGTLRLEVAGVGKLQRGLVRRAEVGRAAEKPGNVLREHVEHLPGSIAAGEPLGIGWKRREILVPAGGKLATLHRLDFSGQRRVLCSVVGKELLPGGVGGCAAGSDAGREVLADAFGHEKRGVGRPAVGHLGETDLFLAQRFAVGRGGVVLVG